MSFFCSFYFSFFLGTFTEDKIHLVFYKGKGNAANGLSTKVNLCLHLIDAFILPTILDELRHNGWNGEMIDLNPKEWSSASHVLLW